MNQSQSDQEEIAVCAYFIWVAEGYPEGRALVHWLQAEMQLEATRAHERRYCRNSNPSEER